MNFDDMTDAEIRAMLKDKMSDPAMAEMMGGKDPDAMTREEMIAMLKEMMGSGNPEAQKAEGNADTLIAFGDSIKALPDNRVGGYLIRFTSNKDTDLTGEYFDAHTDFGSPAHLPVLYHHGLDAKMGRRRIGTGTTRIDEVGLWVEAQLEARDEYERRIYKLAQEGKLSWSSGAAAHTVVRQYEGKAARIAQWFMAEASLTPTPAEARNVAIALKSLIVNEQTQNKAQAESIRAEFAADSQSKLETQKGKNIMEEKVDIQAAVKAELDKRDAALKAVQEQETALKAAQEAGYRKAQDEIAAAKKTGKFTAPATKKVSDFGDPEGREGMKGFFHYARTGQPADGFGSAMKASNDDEQTIGTTTEGGFAVPTGLVQSIFARKDDTDLTPKLGLTRVAGKGTTVDFVVDNEDDGEFVSTGETSAFDRDAVVIDKKSFTLVKYTKKAQLTYELLQDEDAQFESFLANWVGRGMAKTLNDLLITEVETSGTSLKTFAAAATIAAGEIDVMPFNAALANYLDDSKSVAWVMNPSTHGVIYALSGNNRIYADVTQGQGAGLGRAQLLGYPVHYTAKADAYAASKKSVFFGNWSCVGYRLDPELTVLRDPYSNASTGIVNLHFYFRAVYKVLQAEAIGYGEHPSA